MERIETKDTQGNTISVSNIYSQEEINKQNEGYGALFLLGGIAAAVYYFFLIIENPSSLDYPYYFFAKFYQLILYYPFQFGKNIFQFLWALSFALTQYENLNLCIACIVVGIVGIVFLKVVGFIFDKLSPFGYYFLLAPGFIWIICLLGEFILSWLLKK